MGMFKINLYLLEKKNKNMKHCLYILCVYRNPTGNHDFSNFSCILEWSSLNVFFERRKMCNIVTFRSVDDSLSSILNYISRIDLQLGLKYFKDVIRNILSEVLEYRQQFKYPSLNDSELLDHLKLIDLR